MNRALRLGEDNLFKLLFKLALPSLIAQLVNVSYGIVDRIFISGLPVIGDLALAGVGVSVPIISVISAFSFLVALGGAPLMAMRMGAGRDDDAKKILSNAFSFLAILSVVITITFLIFKRPMLLAFGCSEATYPYADTYLTIYLLGNIFAMLSIGMNTFINAQGNSGMSMVTVLIGAIANIFLDALFINVFQMGVAGAAIATVIAQALSCCWVLSVLVGKKIKIRLTITKLDFVIIRRIVLLGMSPFIMYATDGIMMIIFNSVLQRSGGVALGDSYIVTATIVMSYFQVIVMPLGGLTIGCQPLLSYNYGAGNMSRVRKSFGGMITMVLVFTGVMTVVSQIFAPQIAGIFTSDSQILELSTTAIRIYTSGIMFMSIQWICVDSLVGLGVTVRSLALSINRKFLIMVPMIFILPHFWGGMATFYAEPIADIVGGIISGIVFLFVFKELLGKKADSGRRGPSL